MQKTDPFLGPAKWRDMAVPSAAASLAGGSPGRGSPSRPAACPLCRRPCPVHFAKLIGQRQQPPLFGDFLLPAQLPPHIAQRAPHEPEHRLHHRAPVSIPLPVLRFVEPL